MSTISKKKLDSLIPKAIDVINGLNFKDKNGYISKTFHGYISSFGADMINTSPLAAAIFTEEASKKESETSHGTKEDRSLVSLAILTLLKKNNHSISSQKLSEYLISKSPNGITSPKVVNDILAAAVALKIALRTFKKS